MYETDVDSGKTRLLVSLPNAGTSAHDTSNFFDDRGFFTANGAESLGGIGLSGDGATLYAVNMGDKRLYSVPTAGGAPTDVPIPDPDCVGGQWRPFGLTVHDNVVYVGGVCDASVSGLRKDLRAVVYTFDHSAFTKVLDHALDFPRGMAWYALGNDAKGINTHWNPWLTQAADLGNTISSEASGTRYYAFAQPELSSIAVENDGSLILGFRDRFADQIANGTSDPRNGTHAIATQSAGDINKVCMLHGTYNWEGTGGCPNNNTGYATSGITYSSSVAEYFPGHYYVPSGFSDPNGAAHQTTAQGAIGFSARQPDVVSSSLDPLTYCCIGGLAWFDRATGKGNGKTPSRGLHLVSNNPAHGNTSSGGFAKSNGLGTLAMLALPGPVQIGNRVWFDANRNGIQDADEVPIAGAVVNLFKGSEATGTPAATTSTDADGEYYFGGDGADYQLAAGADYTVQFDVCNVSKTSLPGSPTSVSFTQPTAGKDTTLDSNVVPPTTGKSCLGTAAVKAPSNPGEVDHTIDAGIAPAPKTYTPVGWLFHDKVPPANATITPGEPGIPGIVVQLLHCDGTPVVSGGSPVTTTTQPTTPAGFTPPAGSDGSGFYDFPDVAAGCYMVAIDVPPGLPPAESDYRFNPPPPGSTPGTPGVSNFVPPTPSSPPATPSTTWTTPPFTVGPKNPQPENDGALEQRNQLGDFVWVDTNHDGIQHADEPGVNGVQIDLLNCDGTPVMGPDGKPMTTVTGPAPKGLTPDNDTNGDGFYRFTGLVDGCYQTKFEMSELPAGYSSYSLTTPGKGTPGNNSTPDSTTWTSPQVTLGPTNRIDLTLDAGIIQHNELGDFVWRDKHHDGVQHPDDPGVNGVPVALLSCDGSAVKGVDGKPMTTVTGPAPKGLNPANDPSGDGYYHFGGLDDGCYKVQFTPPNGASFTTQFVGDNCADSHADPKTGIGTAVTLGPKDRINLCQDAGLVFASGSLSATGVKIADGIAAALVLLTIGGGLLLAARRRRAA